MTDNRPQLIRGEREREREREGQREREREMGWWAGGADRERLLVMEQKKQWSIYTNGICFTSTVCMSLLWGSQRCYPRLQHN